MMNWKLLKSLQSFGALRLTRTDTGFSGLWREAR